MRRKWLFRIALAAITCAAWWKTWKSTEDDPVLSLMLFMLTGAGLGFLVLGTVLPWLANAIGNSIFIPGERTTPPVEEEPPPSEEDTHEPHGE